MTNTLLEKSSIHPSAVIHPSAEIGEGVTIGPNVVIGEGVKIGNGTRIIANNNHRLFTPHNKAHLAMLWKAYKPKLKAPK